VLVPGRPGHPPLRLRHADNPALAGRQRRLFEIEYLEPDAVKHAALARGTAPVGALSQATGGDLSRSRRWAELLGPGGIGDELRAALMADGVCWGSLVLYRERRGGRFRTEDVETVGALLPILARLAPRLAVAPGGFDCPTDSPSPGLLVLGPDLTPLAASPPARRWLAAAGTGSALPGLVYALVARLWAVERGAPGALPPRVRARTAAGRWILVQAVRLEGPSLPGAIGIVIEPAPPSAVVPLLMAAYAFSRREREVARLVLEGRSGPEIAASLHISPLTVQDHLKAIFAKAGVRGRRQLAAALPGSA
jgi:DNA-binding CsgD family transcriptional regulator